MNPDMDSLESVDAPQPLTHAQRQAKYMGRKDAPGNGMRYKHDNSRWMTHAKYLSRRFLAWDGEGVTVNGEHLYVMLANSRGADIVSEDGLDTETILRFVTDQAMTHEGDINVIYGGGYDFNMWVKDFDRDELSALYRHEYMRWRGYRLGWRQGKSLYIARLGSVGQVLASVTIYDVVSFFQTSFVNACDDYLGERFESRDMIVENKALRSSFTLGDVERVREYNRAELHNLETLMGELRNRLNKVGLRPRRWDGPGAIASALLLREHVKKRQCETPLEVAEAARFAYAGGRFEVIRFGRVSDVPSYEYDVNSAYPSALRHVPDLNRGRWRHVGGDPGDCAFAVYHIRSVAHDEHVPGPLFRRDPNGTICYPRIVTGWYWSPEYRSTRAYCDAGYGEMEVLEAWVFDHDETAPHPFDFVEPLYLKRKALKKGGDGAHVGIKLGLNSLYGKLAQQVGWRVDDKGNLRIPPFHQLEWAGYATSHCRAEVLKAALLNLESVIAFETDAVFTSERLPVKVGAELGDFEETVFEELTYVQSGLYFARCDSGATIDKTRGVDRGTLTLDAILAGWNEPLAADRFAEASLTRFVGAGVALAQSWERWRRWEVMEKRMRLEPTGKRLHVQCPACSDYRDGVSPIAVGKWHETFCPFLNDAHSSEFPVMWINPDPAMTELEELRMVPTDYE